MKQTLALVTMLSLALLQAPQARATEPASAEAPFVNVMDFGAHPDNDDNTSQIQQAIDTGKKAVVPPGNYVVSGTLVIGEAEYLHLAHGAWLRRLADRSKNTEPVVRLTGNFPRLTGEGEACGVSSDNASGGRTGDDLIHNGVINVGPVRAEDNTNINFWVIDSICVSGSGAAWTAYWSEPYPDDVDRNELVTLVNPATLSAGRGSCYLGRVSNCLFRYGGVAIKANPVCNGNMFTNNHFYRITQSCYFSDTTTENLFTNCFVHGDPGVTVIRMKKTGYNHCYGVMAEPGPTAPNGRYTRFCDISADSGQNVLIGHGNTGHSYINDSESSLVITHAQLSHGRAASFGSVAAGSVRADAVTALNFGSPEETESSDKHHEVFVKTFSPSSPTEYQDVLKFTCDSVNQVFMIELSVTSSHESTSNHSSAKYIISGKRGSDNSASASVDLIGGNEAIQCRTQVQENEVTVQLKPSYYLHGQFIIRVNSTSNGRTALSQL